VSRDQVVVDGIVTKPD